MVAEDFKEITKFWKEHYDISDRDDYEHIKYFLEKNAGFSTVAVDAENKIVGTVLASYDGRKGYIQKMAVNKDLRGQGIGKKMLKNTLDKLKEAGALDIRVNCSEKLIPFYRKCGFEIKNVTSMQIRNY